MKRFAIQVTAFFVWTGMNVQEPKFPFNNAELPVDQIVEDLL